MIRRPTRLVTRSFAIVAVLGALASCGDKGGTRDSSGAVVKKGSWSVFDLHIGDCLDAAEVTGDIDKIDVVPCDVAHTQEVFATVKSTADAFPGGAALTSFADASCIGQLQTSVGVTPADGYFVSYLLPSFESWNKNDDRTVTCVLVFPSTGPQQGSVLARAKQQAMSMKSTSSLGSAAATAPPVTTPPATAG